MGGIDGHSATAVRLWPWDAAVRGDGWEGRHCQPGIVVVNAARICLIENLYRSIGGARGKGPEVARTEGTARRVQAESDGNSILKDDSDAGGGNGNGTGAVPAPDARVTGG